MKISRIALIVVLAVAGSEVFANNISKSEFNVEYSSVLADKKTNSIYDLLPETITATEVAGVERKVEVKEKVYTPEQKASIVELKLKSSKK